MKTKEEIDAWLKTPEAQRMKVLSAIHELAGVDDLFMVVVESAGSASAVGPFGSRESALEYASKLTMDEEKEGWQVVPLVPPN